MKMAPRNLLRDILMPTPTRTGPEGTSHVSRVSIRGQHELTSVLMPGHSKGAAAASRYGSKSQTARPNVPVNEDGA